MEPDVGVIQWCVIFFPDADSIFYFFKIFLDATKHNKPGSLDIKSHKNDG